MLLTPQKRPWVSSLPSQDAPLAQDQELRIKDRTPRTTPPPPPLPNWRPIPSDHFSANRSAKNNSGFVPFSWWNNSVDFFNCWFHWKIALIYSSKGDVKVLQTCVWNMFVHSSSNFEISLVFQCPSSQILLGFFFDHKHQRHCIIVAVDSTFYFIEPYFVRFPRISVQKSLNLLSFFLRVTAVVIKRELAFTSFLRI